MSECRLYDFPWIDTARREGTLKKGFYGYDPVLGVKEDDFEDLAVLVAKRVVKIFEKFTSATLLDIV